MPEIVDRERVRALVARGAQLVEVLDEDEYGRLHLASALNLPLARLSRESAAALLNPQRAVVVYCEDQQ